MTTDHVIVFADADPPMMPLNGRRTARPDRGARRRRGPRGPGRRQSRIRGAHRRSHGDHDRLGTCRSRSCAKAPRLEVISYLGTGAANMIDLDEAAQRGGITVSNTPGYGDNAVAEHAVALLFAVARDIPRHDRTLRTQGWDQLDPAFELRGKKLGLNRTGRHRLARGRDRARHRHGGASLGPATPAPSALNAPASPSHRWRPCSARATWCRYICC